LDDSPEKKQNNKKNKTAIHASCLCTEHRELFKKVKHPAGPKRPERSRVWSYLVYRMLGNSNTLTVNYSVKQSQFIKPISEPRARNPEDSNETFDRVI